MNTFLLLLLAFMSNARFSATHCQGTDAVQEQRWIRENVRIFETDALGRIWVVDQKNQIHLYDENGNKKYSFADNRLGTITSLDVSNPLKALVFYGDFGIIRFLDNTLTEVDQVKLQDSGKFFNVTAAALSNDNNIWIYDIQWQRIFKISPTLEILKETNVFNDLGLSGFKPFKLAEKANLLVAASKDFGFVVFDNFGQMKNQMLLKEVRDFQFEGTKILCQLPTTLMIQTMEPPNQFKLPLPQGIKASEIQQVRLTSKRWYMAYPDGIDWIAK